MKYSNQEHQRFQQLLKALSSRPELAAMKTTPQHKGNTSYAHCVGVTTLAFRIATKLRLRIDMESLIHGAMMHDFYLYDTETMAYSDYQHSLNHPKLSLENAEKVMALNKRERNIILSHMWPIPGAPLPRCREAWLVCLADKICAWREMHGRR